MDRHLLRHQCRNQTKTLLGIETVGCSTLAIGHRRRNQTKTLLGIETISDYVVGCTARAAAIKLKPY